MALQDKYRELIQYVNGNGVTDLSVAEQGGILYVTCTAPTIRRKTRYGNYMRKQTLICGQVIWY
jgi:hypothetical protein